MSASARRAARCLLATLALAGCSGPYKEPTIDQFHGKLTKGGQPVSFPAGEKTVLQLVFHKNGERFGIPIAADGTFKIGWMPIGKYSATLERPGAAGAGRGSAPARRFELADGLTIAEGQTDYVLELGEEFKL